MSAAPVGEKIELSYVVHMPEAAWYNRSKTIEVEYWPVWLQQAKELGCKVVVLRLVPDPIFPQTDKVSVYVHEKRELAKPLCKNCGKAKTQHLQHGFAFICPNFAVFEC